MAKYRNLIVSGGETRGEIVGVEVEEEDGRVAFRPLGRAVGGWMGGSWQNRLFNTRTDNCCWIKTIVLFPISLLVIYG